MLRPLARHPLILERSKATALPGTASPTLARQGERVAAFAALGGLFLIVGLAPALVFEQFKPNLFLIFLFMSCAAPALSACLIFGAESSDARHASRLERALVAAKAFLLCCLMGLIAFVVGKARIWHQDLPAALPVIVFAASAAAIAVGFAFWSRTRSGFSTRLDACIVVALAAGVFVLSPFSPDEPVPVGLLRYALEAPKFGVWLLLGIAWTVVGIWLRRRESWAFPRSRSQLVWAAVFAAGLVIVSLYDDGHFVDHGHYLPLVGPALNAMHGGAPMVDAYSQYGLLPWLAVLGAFELFSPTFGTAAVVMRLINLIYLGVILSIVFFVSRRRLSALWFLVPAILVAITSHNPGPTGMWNMNALPMTLGGRWLLPASITLVLIVMSGQNWARWVALALIMLASLSSLEILMFTLAPWGYCLLLDSVRARSLRLFVRQVALAGAAIVVAQAAFAAAIYLSSGSVIDYRPYFDLFFRFRPAEESHWWVPFDANYALWFPIGAAYFLIMATATYRALRGEAADTIVERLLPVAVLGLGPLAYFFGRPQEGTLNIACLSFAAVAIGVAEVMFVNARRFGPAGPALMATMALAFAFTAADGFEHFMRPLEPSRGNATVLRRCLSDEGCRLADVVGNIDLALHTQPLDRRTKVGHAINEASRARIAEVISMLRRWAPEARYVGMLTDYNPVMFADPNATIGMTAFMATGQWYAWKTSGPLMDGVSPVITDRILNDVASTPSGMLIILSNRTEERVALTKKILARLEKRCRLRLVEQGEYNSAFLTENCSG